MKQFWLGTVCFMFILAVSGCGTVGNEFDMALAKTVTQGKSTKQEVRELLGKPFKTGIQNGDDIWVYEENKYKAIGQDSSKNFIVVFNKQGIVKSTQLMSSEPTP